MPHELTPSLLWKPYKGLWRRPLSSEITLSVLRSSGAAVVKIVIGLTAPDPAG
ncbi:hypothetical protein FHS23_003034 [Prauserella isguenensis]|uniref:Uncharacterized protein n=1 Tax=Prauserella isguenensis TaxID=1470180 RepID=A0A839S2T4_9PSEU|nr:hypothetical protein [Prauserella isguenensis]